MKKHDAVTHPRHYMDGGIETITFIRAKLTPEEFRGYCKGNVLKYVTRERGKGGDEDLEKAMAYIKFLIANRRGRVGAREVKRR